MEIEFKLAADSDIDLLVELVGQFYSIDLYPFDAQTVRAALMRVVGDASLGQVWLISNEDAVIGYAVITFGYSLMYHGRDAFVDELFIRAEHRGKGVGTKAMRFIEGACLRAGVNALHLEVERDNEAGQSLYRKMGYEDHDRYLMTKWIKE